MGAYDCDCINNLEYDRRERKQKEQPQSTTGQLNDSARSTDLIDRQQAIDAVNHICPVDTEYDCTLLDRVDVRYVLSDLPSVQPEPQEGEWVQIQRCTGDAQPDLECPFCKHRIGWWDMGRYCAGCGAKLEGGAG